MSTEDKSGLVSRMRALADAEGLPADHQMRKEADAFEKAIEGFYGEPQTVKVGPFFRVWASARRYWCDYTKEPLI